MMKTRTDDDRLLQQFFAEHQQQVADNGFTERVMAVLPAREDEVLITLRRWRWALNTLTVLCIMILGTHLALHLWSGIHEGTLRIMSGGITLFHSLPVLLEPDNLLVQFVRFIQHLLQMLPNPTQLLALFLTTLILLPISVKAVLRHWTGD